MGQRFEAAARGADDVCGAGGRAPVPPWPEPGFVVEAERYGAVEIDDLAGLPAEGFKERRFGRQPAGIGNRGRGAGDPALTIEYATTGSGHGTGSTCRG